MEDAKNIRNTKQKEGQGGIVQGVVSFGSGRSDISDPMSKAAISRQGGEPVKICREQKLTTLPPILIVSIYVRTAKRIEASRMGKIDVIVL